MLATAVDLVGEDRDLSRSHIIRLLRRIELTGYNRQTIHTMLRPSILLMLFDTNQMAIHTANNILAFEEVGHSDEARAILEGFLIGTLKRLVWLLPPTCSQFLLLLACIC